MKKLTIKQWELLEKLSKEFPSHYTLQDILNRDDLNPHKEGSIPIENVKFNIKGILQYAYECTGDTQEFTGTIKSIIIELVNYDDVFNDDNCDELEMAFIKDIWSEEEIKELAKFFLGDRDETHLSDITATSTRSVTLEEIINYIRELSVVSDFEYKRTEICY